MSEAEKIALLPCPMCGEEEPIVISEDRVWIECPDCPSKVEVGPFDVRAEAIAAWNRRTLTPEQRDD